MFAQDDVAFEIRKLNLLIMREFEQLKETNPKVPTKLQAAVLFYLYKKQAAGVDTYQKDIEQQFFIRASTVTALIKNMEHAGLIERVSSSHDGRLKKLVTTKKSDLVVKGMKENMLAVRDKLLSGLTEEELSSFITLIHKLQNNLEGTK